MTTPTEKAMEYIIEQVELNQRMGTKDGDIIKKAISIAIAEERKQFIEIIDRVFDLENMEKMRAKLKFTGQGQIISDEFSSSIHSLYKELKQQLEDKKQ